MDSNALLLQALMSIDRGDRESARALLARVLASDSRNDAAWVALSRAVDDPIRRRECLTRALTVNPGNVEARRRLAELPATGDPQISFSRTAADTADRPVTNAALAGHPPLLPAQEPAPGWVLLSCPTCGNKLKITPDVDRFDCEACGNKFVIRPSGGAVYVAPLVAEMQDLHHTVDRTEAQLALIRLEQEMSGLETRKIKAWAGFERGFRNLGLVLVIGVVLAFAPCPVRSVFSLGGVPLGFILLPLTVVALIWSFGRSARQRAAADHRIRQIHQEMARYQAVVGPML